MAHKWCKFYLKILFLFCYYGVAVSHKCGVAGLHMPGYTVPEGDITIEYGNPLEIICVINTQIENASRFMFFRINNNEVPSEMVDIVNSTAIKLHIDKPETQGGSTFNCEIKNPDKKEPELICMNRVSVGTKPQPVTDFRCIGYYYHNFTCTWTAPQNYIKTNYSLSYTVGQHQRGASRSEINCSVTSQSDNSTMSCVLYNEGTHIAYRYIHKYFNFVMKMENEFGETYMKETIDHYANVLTGPPENLAAINTTFSSIYLTWRVPSSMKNFPPGIEYRVWYQCEYDEKKWHFGGMNNSTQNTTINFNLTGLKHPHALCDIRVSLRSADALPDDESKWSRNASITVRTSSKIPERPPDVDVGSFEVVSYNLPSRDVYIYWKQLREEEKNGPDFRYNVTCKEDPTLKSVEVTHTYARFHGLLSFAEYTFYIWSQNAKGRSDDFSTIRVPSDKLTIGQPLSFMKTQMGKLEYELTWDHPNVLLGQEIKNYTIFMCKDDKDRPYQCKGLLDFKTVPSNITSTTVNVTDPQKMYQFAISANAEKSSSGMVWASCTVIHSKNMGKLKSIWINRIGAREIELGWKIDCSDQIGSPDAFIVHYCPIKSPTQSECKAPQVNSTFYGSTVSGGTIDNLQPYTTYMMTVSVRTKHNTFSQQSDPLYNTTLEAVPTYPPKLKIVEVTNSSIAVLWEPPTALNGILREYKLSILGGGLKPCIISLNNTQMNYNFTALHSYEDYNISVSACTVECIMSHETVKTLMGKPSKMAKPTVNRRNGTTISVIWNKPQYHGGLNDYYVVRFTQNLKQQNKTIEFNTTDKGYIIKNCGDDGKYNTFYISVKAVNKVSESRHESGPWSEELENYCDTPFDYIMTITVIIVGAVLLSLPFVFFRVYNRCKIMRDVEVKLPPGLAPVITDQTLVPWSTEKQESRLHSPPDEELLLVKMNEGSRHFSGDSSGCSSGHESATSSLQSGTHISASSDSGTEQSGTYCAVGISPKVDSAYVPVTSEPEKNPYQCEMNESSPYVLTGETVKTTPGYIPFNQTQPIEKNTGYVVAGIKNVNGYIPFNQTDAVSRNTGYVVAGTKNCKLD